MNTQEQRDGLQWKHKPIPELVRLAWPIAVSMLSYSVMTIASTLFVGRLGASALAGVGLGSVAAFGLIGFGFGALRGVKVVVSQAIGAGRRAEIPAYIASGVVIAVALGVVSVGAGRLIVRVLPDFAASAEAGHHAATYLNLRNLGAPFALIAISLREARYGLSDSRSPLVSAVAANVVNIALDAIFILGLGYGVAGAGAATAIAHGVEVAVLIRASRSPGVAFGLARVRHVADVLRIGLPLGLQFLLEIGAFSVLVVMLARVSDVDLAAHQIALQVIHFSFLPALAIGEAASVLVGQAVGAGEDGLVKSLARQALAIAAVYTGTCGLVFAVGGSMIAGAFTAEPSVRSLATQLLWVAAAFQIFDAGSVVARCVLRGTGDVRFPAVIAVVTAWGFTPPLTWLLGYRLGLGALGGWLGLCAEIVVGSALLWWRLERGQWLRWASESRARLASLAGEANVPVPVVASR
jgi:MATE family multidrug resistance protein